jgi:tetratricopeptide (TPR) repeat protein
VKDNPDIIDGWWLLGRSLARSGREEEALRVLKEGAQRFPGNASILLATADVLFSMDRHGEARAHAELAVKDEPVRAREFLAMMDLRRGDLGSAEREIRAALEAAPARTDTLVLLADILRKQNRRAEELAVLEQARLGIEQRKLAPVGNLHFHRGEALLQQGRVPDAEAAFRSETRDFPSNRQAWASLALVVGAQGRRDEAREILMEGLQKNPDAKMRALAVESFEVMGDAEGARMVQRQSRGGRPLR